MVPEGGSAGASRRARRIEEAVLEVDGVVGVRVWELPDRVEIGVVAAMSDAPSDVLRRMMDVTDALRAPDEVWDVGLLVEGISVQGPAEG